MSRICFFQKAKIALNFFKCGNYSTCVGIRHNSCCIPLKSYAFKKYIYYQPLKNISNYSSMQTKDTETATTNKNLDGSIRKALEDEEFQNILKDFAKDFGVDSESDEVLKDIRKNLEQEQKNKDRQCSRDDTPEMSFNTNLKKYKEFTEDDIQVINSYEEKYEYSNDDYTYHVDHEQKPKMLHHHSKRGVTGVFDIDELIPVLQSESLLDITTISIPKELHYADYLVLATARSERHCEAAVEFILKLYKQKKYRKDPFLKVDGEKVTNWKAIDMGNIVIHIFLEETRALYDLESLWLFDSSFDSGGNIEEDPALKIIEEQLAFFNSMYDSTTSKEIPKDTS